MHDRLRTLSANHSEVEQKQAFAHEGILILLVSEIQGNSEMQFLYWLSSGLSPFMPCPRGFFTECSLKLFSSFCARQEGAFGKAAKSGAASKA